MTSAKTVEQGNKPHYAWLVMIAYGLMALLLTVWFAAAVGTLLGLFRGGVIPPKTATAQSH